jgi:predicted nucleic acid-binding protein
VTDELAPLLLDTTAFSALFRGAEQDAPYQRATADHDLLVSWVTVGEVLHGAMKKSWGDKRLAELEIRIAAVAVIPGTIGVARAYARLRTRFGTSKSQNDMWIVACSMALPERPPIVSGDNDFVELCNFAEVTLIQPG